MITKLLLTRRSQHICAVIARDDIDDSDASQDTVGTHVRLRNSRLEFVLEGLFCEQCQRCRIVGIDFFVPAESWRRVSVRVAFHVGVDLEVWCLTY